MGRRHLLLACIDTMAAKEHAPSLATHAAHVFALSSENTQYSAHGHFACAISVAHAFREICMHMAQWVRRIMIVEKVKSQGVRLRYGGGFITSVLVDTLLPSTLLRCFSTRGADRSKEAGRI